MGYLDYKFSPSDIQELLGISATLLRNWRMRGYLEGIGAEQGNGRWKYSSSNLVRLSIVQVLTAKGYVASVEDALFFAESVEIDVLDYMFIDLDPDIFGFNSLHAAFRFSVFEKTLIEKPSYLCWKMPIIGDFYGSLPPFSNVIDACTLENSLPKEMEKQITPPSKRDIDVLRKVRYLRRRLHQVLDDTLIVITEDAPEGVVEGEEPTEFPLRRTRVFNFYTGKEVTVEEEALWRDPA